MKINLHVTDDNSIWIGDFQIEIEDIKDPSICFNKLYRPLLDEITRYENANKN